jgi:hypothetical protein
MINVIVYIPVGLAVVVGSLVLIYGIKSLL